MEESRRGRGSGERVGGGGGGGPPMAKEERDIGEGRRHCCMDMRGWRRMRRRWPW